MKWQIANAVLSSHTRWALKQGFNRYSPSYLGPYENCSLLAYISFYWFTYILNQIFENVTAKWTSPTKQLFYGQNLQSSQLKTKSAAIAFFCSPVEYISEKKEPGGRKESFFPPGSFFSPISFSFGAFRAEKNLLFGPFSLKWLKFH